MYLEIEKHRRSDVRKIQPKPESKVKKVGLLFCLFLSLVNVLNKSEFYLSFILLGKSQQPTVQPLVTFNL